MPKLLSVLLQQHRAQLLDFAETESLLSTHPDEHAGSRGLRVVDPGLGVWVNTDTQTKIALLRRIFAALALDPEELVFTLRPTKDGDGTGAVSGTEVGNAAADGADTSAYAALTKFRDAVAEAAALHPDAAATADLRTEFATEFAPFRRESWMADLGGQNLTAFATATPVDDMTAEQVLAVISGLFVTEQLIGPGAVHQSIIDGSMSRYLERLAELG
jgi:hypothetical protein